MNEPVFLVVEDDEADVLMTTRALAAAHVANRVVALRDGVEALDWLFREGEHAARDPALEVAIVFLDLRMPRLDGFRVLERIRADERTRTIPVIIVTDLRAEEDRARSLAAGADAFLRKPLDFAELVAATRHLGFSWFLCTRPESTRSDVWPSSP